MTKKQMLRLMAFIMFTNVWAVGLGVGDIFLMISGGVGTFLFFIMQAALWEVTDD